MPKIRLIQFEDTPMCIKLTNMILSQEQNIEYLESYKNRNAIEALISLLPADIFDILLLDYNIGDINGTEVLEKIGEIYPNLDKRGFKIIGNSSEKFPDKSIDFDCPKTESSLKLVQTINSAYQSLKKN